MKSSKRLDGLLTTALLVKLASTSSESRLVLLQSFAVSRLDADSEDPSPGCLGLSELPLRTTDAAIVSDRRLFTMRS